MTKIKFGPMEEINFLCLFLAKFDQKAYEFFDIDKSNNQIHEDIAMRYKINSMNVIKNIRDEYDSFFPFNSEDGTGSNRVGWKRKLDKKKKNIYDLYRDINFEEAKTICNEILTKRAVYYQDATSSKKYDDVNLSKIKIRQFTDEGHERYSYFFNQAYFDPKNYEYDINLLLDDKYTEIIDDQTYLDQNLNFTNQYQFAKYLNEKLENCFNENLVNENKKLFDWLTYLYFKSLFPGPNGGKDWPRYFLTNEGNNSYRHLVKIPIELFREYGDLSKVFLSNVINSGSDLIEQSTSNQGNDFFNQNTLKLTNELFLIEDGEVLRTKKGAKMIKGKGSFRRLKKILKNYMINYHLASMDYRDLKDKIFDYTDEFNQWVE